MKNLSCLAGEVFFAQLGIKQSFNSFREIFIRSASMQ